MDPGHEPASGDAKSPRKRTWSAEFTDQPYSSFNQGPRTTERPLTGTSPDAETGSKRPRMSKMVPGGTRPGQYEDIVLRDPLTLVDLPHEILQHIFTFVDPVSLGRLIRVNRSFRSLLDPTTSLPQASGQVKHLTIRSQDLIWATSRKTFLQGFPKPMDDMTELEMWRLVRGRFCQYCGKKTRKGDQSLISSPWTAGPGPETIRTIWPFRVKSCGSCLEPRLIKETELLFSSVSVLKPGLPFAIFTSDLNYIPFVVLQQAEPPPRLTLVKYYFKPQLEELQSRLNGAQALGIPAAEEWYKGLESTGQQQNADAARFDQWELQGGLSRISVTSQGHPTNIISSPEVGFGRGYRAHPVESSYQAQQASTPPATSSGYYSPRPPNPIKKSHGLPENQQASMALQSFPPVPGQQISGTTGSVHKQDPSSPISMRPPSRQRMERSQQDAEQIKAQRRREIERRCQALEPPIMPSTLTYMESFQAAIKISQPLNDKAWEILKPRLLMQRLEAEHKEKIHNASLGNPAIQLEKLRQLQEEQRVAEQNVHHMWLELKVPSRDKLQKYAREFIHQTWSDGHGVTKFTASKFAAEVLCHVRQRFDEAITQEDAMLKLKGTAFPQDPESLACRKLRLDDMKWAFEEFVKPHTERFGKELFLCRVCDANQKLFSFEAVIQHYAAKHTSALSHGNAVVYWKSDWPSEPPFDPSPNIPWIHEGIQSISPNFPRPASPSSKAWSPTVEIRSSTVGGYQNQANEVAALAVEFWQRTDGIRDLSNPVRLFIVIQHINLRFLKKFSDEPGLPLFADAVTNRPELQPLRGLSDLRCKICSNASRAVSMERNGLAENWYSLPQLLNHFQQAHLDIDASSSGLGGLPLSSRATLESARLDWKQDMIWLPSEAAIRPLLHLPGVDQDKLQIIAEAFPSYFPPYIVRTRQFAHQNDSQVPFAQEQPFVERVRPGTGHGSIRSGGPRSHIAKSEGSVHAMEDEYDPWPPRPAVPRRYPQERYFMSSSPRDGARYRAVSYYPARSPVRREYHYPESEYEPVWEVRDREMPFSHDSVVHSYGDGSSRFSYREPLAINSGTTVGVVSESRPGSKATSRRSLQQAGESETGISLSRAEGQRSGPDEAGSSAAADFLNNFDPMAGEEVTRNEVVENDSVSRQAERQAFDIPRPRSVSDPSQQNQSPFRTGTRIDDQTSTHQRRTPSLPIRESGRPGLASGEYQSRNGYSSTFPHGASEDGAGVHRGRAVDCEHLERLPERPHRIRFEDESGTVQERVVAYANPPYERRYYYEDEYDRARRRYEPIGQAPMEQYPPRMDEATRRYLENPDQEGRRHMDDSRYLERGADREDYVQAVPRDYRMVGDYDGFEHPPEQHVEFVEHNDRYARAEPFEPGQQMRVAAGDNRDFMYKRVDRRRRYAPR
ncbi:uncharacterized protein Z518_09532 [Rhinocladiella mackenziei CBS 650.93]|uniref:F-box domain-containing protein n=1 Tax=Rhinocladiella mackenziei CBS 650.93 TaxID=1442369 RepID=A0A0D2IYU7_9EURO|nr:uncharacterized protein Z518_09532 [Rhinocladiella mackenziei CBS 650.93]KIX01805.1 hypothetical protein Z518_09532 [Rhinocladiella mackenziei CBS 650.93]